MLCWAPKEKSRIFFLIAHHIKVHTVPSLNALNSFGYHMEKPIVSPRIENKSLFKIKLVSNILIQDPKASIYGGIVN